MCSTLNILMNNTLMSNFNADNDIFRSWVALISSLSLFSSKTAVKALLYLYCLILIYRAVASPVYINEASFPHVFNICKMHSR